MSELSFGIMDNNADFQQKTKQLREVIAGLETDFTNLYTSAGNSIKGIEQFINGLRAQIDDIIVALGKIDLENKMHLDSLQPPSQRMFFIRCFRVLGSPDPVYLFSLI